MKQVIVILYILLKLMFAHSSESGLNVWDKFTLAVIKPSV